MTARVADMAPMAEAATGLLKALAHPARLMICCQLKDREMSVGDIEETLGIRQPRLSRELSKLREEGLVATRRQSKVIFYRLSDARAASMVEAVCAVMLGQRVGAGEGPLRHRDEQDFSGRRPENPPPSGRRPENPPGGFGMFARVGAGSARVR